MCEAMEPMIDEDQLPGRHKAARAQAGLRVVPSKVALIAGGDSGIGRAVAALCDPLVLAGEDSREMTAQVLHPDGGDTTSSSPGHPNCRIRASEFRARRGTSHQYPA